MAMQREDHHRVRAAGAGDSAGWPSTLCYSRRLGDALKGADYACSIEGPPRRFVAVRAAVRHLRRWVAGILALGRSLRSR
jgi:hypothetical protein